MIMCAARSAG